MGIITTEGEAFALTWIRMSYLIYQYGRTSMFPKMLQSSANPLTMTSDQSSSLSPKLAADDPQGRL